MAKTRRTREDLGLAEAVRDLTRAQAIAQLEIADSQKRHKEVMADLRNIVAIIVQKLDALPDVVREKIGFVPPRRRAR